MRIVLLAAFLLVGSAVAAPFAVQVGETRIGLDAPPGFADTGFTGSPRLMELAEALTPASNKILLFAISDADLRRFTLGDTPELRRYMIAVTPKGLERERVSPAAFGAFVRDSLAALGSPPAQPYPSKPLRIIVPFTPGSATDTMARPIAERLSSALGQPVVVENRPGAGGTIGIAALAKSPPDGYTLAVVSTGHVVNPVLYANLPYDTLKDFAGVAPLAGLPSVLVVSPELGVRSVRDLVAMAKAKPGQLNYATAGIGSAAHISAEKFRMAAGIDAVHVPLKGSPESLTETMGGRTQFTWTPLTTAVGQIREGRLLALAVSTGRRSPAFPDVPTIAEAGFPRGEFNFWVGMLAPAHTPREVLARLNAETQRALQSADLKERLAKLGAEPMAMSPGEFDAFLRDEYAVLGEVMRAAGVKAQ